MSRLIPLMCVAVAVGASPARAEKARVVVLPFAVGEGASETASSKFHALLIEELKSRGDAIELVAPPSTKPAPAPEKAGVVKRGPSPDAVAALEAGKKAFDDLRFEDAVSNLKKGIEGMLSDPATGCSAASSSRPATRNNSSRPMRPSGMMSSTCMRPVVRVPVLSNTK